MEERGPRDPLPSDPAEPSETSFPSECGGDADTLDRDPELEALVEAFWAALEQGRQPDPEEFCRGLTPERADRLRLRLEAILDVEAPVKKLLARSEEHREGDLEAQPARIKSFRVLKLLGEGGMGSVYLVQQNEPVRRKAALKLVKPGMDSRRILKRFRIEKDALALMNHTNIARVFTADTDERGRPFFVMEYVEGIALDRYCAERRLGLEERVELVIDVCEGVQHAHQKGIVHRDLKPSNILVTDEGGRPVPKIIDFGLARALDPKALQVSLQTFDGQFVGTPEYMSPEQVRPGRQGIDARTDIYSLGVILFQLITGTLPTEGADLRTAGYSAIEAAICDRDTRSPSTVVAERDPSAPPSPGLPPGRRLKSILKGELDWIVLKALEKDPERRYQSAEALAQDLRHFLAGEPVLAGPPSGVYRLKKLLRRHRRFFASLAAILLVLASALAFSIHQYRVARASERRAIADRALLAQYLRDLGAEVDRRPRRDPFTITRPVAGWHEDFEDFASRFVDYVAGAGGSQDARNHWFPYNGRRRVDAVEQPDGSRALRLSGIRGKADGTGCVHLLAPDFGTFVPEFTLVVRYKGNRFEPRKGEGHFLPTQGAISLTSHPHWAKGARQELVSFLKGAFLNRGESNRIYVLAPGPVWPDEEPADELTAFRQKCWRDREGRPIWFPADSWQRVSVHVRCLPGHPWRAQRRRQARDHGPLSPATGMLVVTLAIGGRSYPPVELPLTGDEPYLRFLQLTGPGDDVCWFDELDVEYPLCPQPIVRVPGSDRYVTLTPDPTTLPQAEAWAQSMGGTLFRIEDAAIADWLASRFGPHRFWARYEPRLASILAPGRAGHELSAQSGGRTAGAVELPLPSQTQRMAPYMRRDIERSLLPSGDELPALVAFSRPPVTAFVRRLYPASTTTAGVEAPELRCSGTPRPGAALRLTVRRLRPGARAVLVERELPGACAAASPDLFDPPDHRAPSGWMRLSRRPPAIRKRFDPADAAGTSALTLRLPAGPEGIGRSRLFQAQLVEGSGRVLASSEILQVTIGRPPLPGTLHWAEAVPLTSTRAGTASPAAHSWIEGDQGFEPPGRHAALCVRRARAGRVRITALGTFRDRAFPGARLPAPGYAAALEARGGEDLLLVDFADDGAIARAAALGGPGDERGRSVDPLPDGGLVVGGTFRGTTEFRAAGGGRIQASSAGGTDAFVAFLSKDWHCRALLTIGGDGDDLLGTARISTDGASVYACGSASGPWHVTLQTPGGRRRLGTFGDEGPPRLFVLKLDPRGELAWCRVAAGGFSRATALCVLSGGGVACTGSFYGTLALGRKRRIEAAGGEDILVARLAADGAVRWLARAGTPWKDTPEERKHPECGLDLTECPGGDLCVAGYFKGDRVVFACRPEPAGRATEGSQGNVGSFGGTDGFVMRLDRHGAVRWFTAMRGHQGDDAVRAVEALPDGSLLFGGTFVGYVYLDVQTVKKPVSIPLQPYGCATLGTHPANRDVIYGRLAPNGRLRWTRSAGGTGPDGLTAIALLPDAAPILAGYCSGPATFDLGAPTQAVLMPGGLFVTRLEARGGR